MKSFRVFAQTLALLLALLPTAAFAHGDEVPTDDGVATEHFTAYGHSDRYEMTLYYPELIAGREAHLTLYVADYNSNRPIDGAGLTISTADSPKDAFEVTLVSPGVYEVHATFPENKTYMLNVHVAHPKGADLIGIAGIDVGKKLHEDAAGEDAAHSEPWLWFVGGVLLGGLAVWFLGRRRSRALTAVLLLGSAWFSVPNWNPVFAHGDEEHGPKSGGAGYGKSVYAPKETQFLFEILTQPIAVGDYQPATTMFGTIIPASGGMGVVVAPQGGRVTQVLAAVGQSVRAGQVLAVLQQTIGTPDQVGIAASNAGLAVQVETARTRATAAKRDLERLQKIADIAAAKEVQAAEANYNTALAELQTLEDKVVGANTSANSRSISLVAPISGVVGVFTLAPGAELVAGQTLFTVTNLSKVYVEAQVYDRDVPVVRAGNKFLVTCSTDDHKSAEVRLISQAQTMNPGNQSQRVIFEMDNPQGEFKIGEFVTLKAMNQQTSRQVSVPNSALTEINGKTAIFLKDGPEVFALRYVQTGEDDGTRTLILKGMEEGKRVVVNGAYEVKMMYLNQ